MTATFDLLIHGGTVVDGSGTPGFAADVAVIGDRLRILPRSAGAGPGRVNTPSTGTAEGDDPNAGTAEGDDPSRVPAARRIDATGHVVAPGFIDLHSHSGLMILAEPRHEPKVRQGVTTEVIGVDGNSYAPFRSRDDLRRLRCAQRGSRRPARHRASTGARSATISTASTAR